MKTILVVEDSGSSRNLTSHFLQQGGFRVLEAEDGQQALGILRDRHVDLILTDIMMPNMDGWAFYREARGQDRLNLTPFVFLSVLDNPEEQARELTLGVDDYITKPVTPQQLIARINTALMRSERMKEHSFRDPATGLETPACFRLRLAQEALRCREYGRPLTLVTVDIGNYEALVRGHADWFAEEAAAESGQAIRDRLRDYDLLADMGQGRFSILLPEYDADEAQAWSGRLRAEWNVALLWPETEQRVAVDIGFAVDAISPGEGDAEALLDRRLASLVRKW